MATAERARHNSRDRLLPITRVVAAVVIFFLVSAWVILYIFPHDTERLFAWPIGPRMTAMMLGAAYLGGAYFFAVALLGRSWHAVRLGFLPVATFAAMMGLATILHWDRFTHGHVSFYAWAGLYFTTPFIVPAIWYLNSRHGPGAIEPNVPTLSTSLRVIYVALGVVFAIAAVMLVTAPTTVIEYWSWALSPLTSRVMASLSALAGAMAIAVASDGRWSAVRVSLSTQAVTIGLFLIAMIVARGDIRWERAASWLLLAGLIGILALIAFTWVTSRPSDAGQGHALRDDPQPGTSKL